MLRTPFNKISVQGASIVLLALVVLFVQVKGWRPRQLPKIGISEFATQDEDEHHMWDSDMENIPEGTMTVTDNGQTYIINQPILAMTIDCNASYPIQWNFLNAEDAAENVYSVRIRMFRHAKDVYNPLTNSFTSQLQLYGDTNAVTGTYSCFSTEHEDVQKTIYIYWQGGSASPLIPEEKTEDVCIKPDHTAVLPCRVAEPEARPKLYFEVKCNEKYKLIESPYIKYDPKIGFTIDVSQYNGVFGKYKCSMSEDDSFAAFFNLKNETCSPRVFTNTISNGASFRYNQKEQKVICCSNSSKMPSLQGIFCFDPVSCKMREFRLFKNGNNGTPMKNNGSCVFEKIYERDSGLIRCIGDGIDVMRPFYTDLQASKNDSFNLYFDWNDIEPQKLIAMSISSRKPIYDKQNLTVNCETSYFYFAEGIKWAVRWKNGTLEFLDLESGIYDQDRAGSSYQTLRLPIHINMTDVLCFAPIWNSTDWINKTYSLDIRESIAPKISGDSIETLSLKLNETEQTISCKGSGNPSPLLRWRKNNRTVLSENNIAIKRKNGTMIMTIHRVSHETQGLYKCIATNLAGKTEKVFQIYVIDPGQPLSASAIIFVALLVCVLVTGMGYLLWRMQLQKKIISHLTGIVFRDMSGSNGGNGNSTSVRNSNTVTNNRAHVPVQNGGMEFSAAQVIQESNHI